jgi:hypothetical protein
MFRRLWLESGPHLDDPHFTLRGLPPVLPPGVYELTAVFPNGWESLKRPALLFDRGDGYRAADRIPVFFRPDGKSKSVARAYFRLRSPVTGLRLDPGGDKTIVITDISLKRLPKLLWRMRGFLAHQRRQIRSFNDLARGFGKAFTILAHEGWKGINQAFNEAAEMEASGGFRELPLAEFEARCRQDAANIRKQKHWTAGNFEPTGSVLSIVVRTAGAEAKQWEELLRALAAQSCKLFTLILVFDSA